MSAHPPRGIQFPSPSSRVHSNRFADDEAIADEFPDGLAGIGIGDFIDFVGIEPDFAFSAADDRGGEALLRR